MDVQTFSKSASEVLLHPMSCLVTVGVLALAVPEDRWSKTPTFAILVTWSIGLFVHLLLPAALSHCEKLARETRTMAASQEVQNTDQPTIRYTDYVDDSRWCWADVAAFHLATGYWFQQQQKPLDACSSVVPLTLTCLISALRMCWRLRSARTDTAMNLMTLTLMSSTELSNTLFNWDGACLFHSSTHDLVTIGLVNLCWLLAISILFPIHMGHIPVGSMIQVLLILLRWAIILVAKSRNQRSGNLGSSQPVLVLLSVDVLPALAGMLLSWWLRAWQVNFRTRQWLRL